MPEDPRKYRADLPGWMNSNLAANIAMYRALGMSQVEIAGKLGVSQQTVSRYLLGLKEEANKKGDAEAFFVGLILAAFGGMILALLLSQSKK